MAGRVTIAEVEELVEPGEIDPDEVHLPGVFVQRVVALTADTPHDKRIEKRTVQRRAAGGGQPDMALDPRPDGRPGGRAS